jgi:hypothetical protein
MPTVDAYRAGSRVDFFLAGCCVAPPRSSLPLSKRYLSRSSPLYMYFRCDKDSSRFGFCQYNVDFLQDLGLVFLSAICYTHYSILQYQWFCVSRIGVIVKITFVDKFSHVAATATGERVPLKEGKKRTTMLMTILLTGLFILFVLIVLATLVYTLVRLVNNARAREAVTAGDDKQQPFLKASVLHGILRGGR